MKMDGFILILMAMIFTIKDTAGLVILENRDVSLGILTIIIFI